MLPRVGRALYWAGCLSAGLIVVALYSGALGQATEEARLLSVLAVLVWALGWAARYLFAGN